MMLIRSPSSSKVSSGPTSRARASTRECRSETTLTAMGHNPTGTLHGPEKGGRLSLGRDAIRVVLFDYGHTLVDFRRVPEALVRAYEDIRALLERHVSHELPRAEELAHQVTGAMDVLVHESYVQGRLQELDVIQLLEDAFAGIGIELGPDLAQELVVIDHRAFT